MLLSRVFYEGDSFFTLSMAGQVGLLVLSVTLSLLWLVAVWVLARGRAPIWRLLLAVALFVSFVWASPQIYYQYYRLIIDGLPAQWVIGAPPNLGDLSQLLTFTAAPNLSHHAQGALGWSMLALAALRRRPPSARSI